MLITTAFAFDRGFVFSALMKRTLGASVMTYARPLRRLRSAADHDRLSSVLQFGLLRQFKRHVEPHLQAIHLHLWRIGRLNPLAPDFHRDVSIDKHHVLRHNVKQRFNHPACLSVVALRNHLPLQ